VNTTLRLITGASAFLAGTVNATLTAAAADEPPKGEPVPFETLAIVSGTSGINLGDDQILRLSNSHDIERAGRLLAGGFDSTLADDVVAAIDDIPADTVVLVGVIDTSCTPAEAAGLVRLEDGHLAMFAPGHVPEPIECFVANVTVAVLAVDAADAPPGSTDSAELVHFEPTGYEPPGDVTAVELTEAPDALATILPGDAEVPVLPELATGMRRLAFMGQGCALAHAELWVTLTLVTPHVEQEDPAVEVVCDAALSYLAVFDIPADLVPPNAELDGSIVG
jgi:hypothetical protein